MTKSSASADTQLRSYCVRFTASTCYKITLNARNEKHAITLAKRRWLRGCTDGFVPFAGDTEAWDAEHEPDHGNG